MRVNIGSLRATFLAFWISSLAQGAAPIIDGEFSDWSDRNIVARDEQGDAKASFDITQVSAVTNGTELFLLFDTGSERNIQSGDETDGTLKLVVGLPHSRQLVIDFRAKTATLESDSQESIRWSQLDFVCLPTYASDRYELRMDLKELGVRVCDKIKIDFAGSDELSRPVSIVLKKGPTRRSNDTFAKPNAGEVRIANLNTLHQGLSDAGRSESIKRLLAAVQADVYTFQEEWDETEFRQAARRVVPAEKILNLHWYKGCGVATTLPLEPLVMAEAPGAAVAVTLPGQVHLVVVSTHLKCCGFAGSREDQRRVWQTQQLAEEIRRLRDGKFGDHLRESAVVIIGDYNLVGSRRPLEVLSGAGLDDWILTGLGGNTAATWRRVRDEDPFWPGRLDIVTYDRGRLQPVQGCVVDTTKMDGTLLETLKLRSHDSWASDHLLVVADFKLIQ